MNRRQNQRALHLAIAHVNMGFRLLLSKLLGRPSLAHVFSKFEEPLP